MPHGEFLLAICALALCCTLGGASFARVSSIASETVEANFPAGLLSDSYGHGNQWRRFRREVVMQKLDDPQDCIRYCRGNETEMIITATIQNMARMVSLALMGLKGDEVSTPEKEAAFKQRVRESTIANMGPLFEDLCNASNVTDACYSRCPQSQLRTIVTLDHDGTDVLCEPSNNWDNFTDYWNALNCTNATEAKKPCVNKCGPEKSIANATHLEMKDEPKGMALQYENDPKVNTAAAGPACKSIACEIDCYKPIMTEKCGDKAYDMYSRMSRMEPRSTIRTLKVLKAIDHHPDCARFEK